MAPKITRVTAFLSEQHLAQPFKVAAEAGKESCFCLMLKVCCVVSQWSIQLRRPLTPSFCFTMHVWLFTVGDQQELVHNGNKTKEMFPTDGRWQLCDKWNLREIQSTLSENSCLHNCFVGWGQHAGPTVPEWAVWDVVQKCDLDCHRGKTTTARLNDDFFLVSVGGKVQNPGSDNK